MKYLPFPNIFRIFILAYLCACVRHRNIIIIISGGTHHLMHNYAYMNNSVMRSAGMHASVSLQLIYSVPEIAHCTNISPEKKLNGSLCPPRPYMPGI